jgi:hypothetical protein
VSETLDALIARLRRELAQGRHPEVDLLALTVLLNAASRADVAERRLDGTLEALGLALDALQEAVREIEARPKPRRDDDPVHPSSEETP